MCRKDKSLGFWLDVLEFCVKCFVTILRNPISNLATEVQFKFVLQVPEEKLKLSKKDA